MRRTWEVREGSCVFSHLWVFAGVKTHVCSSWAWSRVSGGLWPCFAGSVTGYSVKCGHRSTFPTCTVHGEIVLFLKNLIINGQTSSPSILCDMSECNLLFVFLQAHPHLSGFVFGVCLLRLLWRCDRGPRERTRHHVLAQRKMGLHWRTLRFLAMCPQEIGS